MTITEQPTVATELRLVTLDLYKDIHKGIRSELFAVTEEAGRADPADRASRAAVAEHVRSAIDLLVAHAEHEDEAIQPSLEAELPDLAARIAADHERIEAWMVDLAAMADDAVFSTRFDQPLAMHRLYLELGSFTGSYLEHQDVEERVVMPALEDAIGVEAVVGIHGAIIGSIPPDEMATSLAVMLPAMNVDDRTALLGGMKANAPAEAFAGIWGLAGTVLSPADHVALGRRLEIG